MSQSTWPVGLRRVAWLVVAGALIASAQLVYYLVVEPAFLDPAQGLQGTYAVLVCLLYWASVFALLRADQRGFVLGTAALATVSDFATLQLVGASLSYIVRGRAEATLLRQLPYLAWNLFVLLLFAAVLAYLVRYRLTVDTRGDHGTPAP